MKKGYYWLADEKNDLYQSFWDGEKWSHHGQSELHTGHRVINEDIPNCQTGCICTQNPDGSWKIVC